MAYSQSQPGFAGAARVTAPAKTEASGGLARAARAKIQHFAAHHVIFHEGDAAERFYELIDGSVMLYKFLPDGRRQVVEILAAGALFGITEARVQEICAESLTPVTVRMVDRRDADSSTDVQCDISRCLMRQIGTLHDHAVLLGRKSATERVASFLMRLVPNRGMLDCVGPTPGTDQRVLDLTMTRQEIADYLGLTIETVSRVISDFKRRGLLVAEKQDRVRLTNVCGVCHLTGAH